MLLTASEDDRRNSVLVPVLVSAFAIPVSMLFWIVNVTYSLLAPDSEYQADGYPVISPWRWLAAVIIPIFMAGWALKKKTLDLSGALLGSFMGFVLTLSSFAHLGCLIAFFVTSSKATKFRAHRKKKVTEDFKINSRRNWIQVLCNGGMATQLALLYLLDIGYGERPIDFDKDYRNSWLSIGILGATACCNGDTWASELGTVVGSSDPFLITSRKRVPRGTNGAVSWFGILVSLLGGLVLGLTYYIIILYTVDPAVLQSAAPQWPIIFAGGVGGLLGSLCDSFLGATLQYSGVDEQGMVVERPGKGVRHISGRQILDNHSVNLLSSIFTSLTLPRLANIFWPQ
ncbi:transmembrane protein 19 isoform X1 [Orussus abietinus]|uniref:transmembrane protein 19 isoform X1 n=1 Tax=Orussus abietinus TaxID=222816 RepID=UPI0006267D64|nr:transmembrane protein 19 isoform X1 [Orussus abietinus]